MKPKLGLPERLASCLGGKFELNSPDSDDEHLLLKDASVRRDFGREENLESSMRSSDSPYLLLKGKDLFKALP